MKKNKNNLDEMQELKLLKIEHNACWIAFWGLCIVILAQTFFSPSPREILPELALLLVLAIYITVACIKNGIWDRKLKPNTKTNFWMSLAFSVAFGAFGGISNYHKYQDAFSAVMCFGMTFLVDFILIFAVLSFCVYLYKKRRKHLEEDCEEND